MEKLGITQEDLDKVQHSYGFGGKPRRLSTKPHMNTKQSLKNHSYTGRTAATMSKPSMLKDSSINKFNDDYHESFYLTHAHVNIDSGANLMQADP